MYAIKNSEGLYFAGISVNQTPIQPKWAPVVDDCVCAYMFTTMSAAQETVDTAILASGYTGVFGIVSI